MRRPTFIAAQARHATGPIGRLIAWIMAKETRGDNLMAIETLAPQVRHRVLDVGTGHGAGLVELSKRIPQGLTVGIDPSEVMVGAASRRNADAIRDGSVEICPGSAEALPFPDASFDGALAVHVLYFWPDLVRPLSEIARVLRQGGRLVLLFRTSDDPHAASFPPSVYRFRSTDEVKSALMVAGFTVEKVIGNSQGEAIRPAIISALRAA